MRKCFLIVVFYLSLSNAVSASQIAQRTDGFNSPRISQFIAVRADGFYPPRIQQICNDNFFGKEYNPKYEGRCRNLWNIWTEELKTQSLVDGFYPLP